MSHDRLIHVIQLSYHPVKPGGLRHFAVVIQFLVCHVIWHDNITSTSLPNLILIGLMKMEISILISILKWIPWKKLNSLPQSTIMRHLLIYNSKVLDTGERKMRRGEKTHATAKHYAFNAITVTWKTEKIILSSNPAYSRYQILA